MMALGLAGRAVWSLKQREAVGPPADTLSSEPAHVGGRAPRGRYVGRQDVVPDHPVGAEAPAQGADGAFDPRDPLARQAVAVAIVIEGNHLVAKRAEQRLAVAEVVQIRRRVGL